jgi:RHS repeat-associated protein
MWQRRQWQHDQRVELSGTQWVTYTQGWDIDNRLIAVTNTVSGQVSRFYYDADGQRVKRVDPSGTTAYVGQHFEVQASAGISTSYYYFGSQRVAMRIRPSGSYSGTLYWIQGDQLGSASLTTNITGTVVSEQRYYPFGETRWVSGTMTTDRLFTGQKSENISLVGSLMDFAAREYSPILGRFLSADSIVPRPGDPQSLNRYSYSRNSPLMRIDPTGHSDVCNPALYDCGGSTMSPVQLLRPLFPEKPARYFPDPAARWLPPPSTDNIGGIVDWFLQTTGIASSNFTQNSPPLYPTSNVARNITFGIRVSGGGKDRMATISPDQLTLDHTALRRQGIQAEVPVADFYEFPNVQRKASFLYGVQNPAADTVSISYGAKDTVKVTGGSLALQVDYTLVVKDEFKPAATAAVVLIGGGLVIAAIRFWGTGDASGFQEVISAAGR